MVEPIILVHLTQLFTTTIEEVLYRSTTHNPPPLKTRVEEETAQGMEPYIYYAYSQN